MISDIAVLFSLYIGVNTWHMSLCNAVVSLAIVIYYCGQTNPFA